MGQQQIILLVLVTVIVGIAMVVAIDTMQEVRAQSNKEAISIDLMNAAAEAQSYFRKSDILGGGGKSFSNIEISDLAISPSNENGTFSISNRSPNSFRLTGTPSGGADPVEVVIYEDSIVWEE